MNPADVAAMTETLRVFDGELVDVRPRGGVGWSFPDEVEGQPRCIGALTSCADCGSATWARYEAPRCRACAWARWRLHELQAWRKRLA